MGNETSRAAAPPTRKPIHQAPTQWGSSGLTSVLSHHTCFNIRSLHGPAVGQKPLMSSKIQDGRRSMGAFGGCCLWPDKAFENVGLLDFLTCIKSSRFFQVSGKWSRTQGNIWSKSNSRQVDLCVDVEEVSSQQVTNGWTQNGCCVEDACGDKDRSEPAGVSEPPTSCSWTTSSCSVG